MLLADHGKRGEAMPRTKSSRQPTEGRLAAIYARVSDKSQAEDDKTSIGEQIAEMEAYCENRGLTITVRYQEIGHGWSKMRSEFQRMLADARAGRFDTIVCWKSDRLSRGMYPAAALMEVVEAYQMRLEAVTDSIDIKTFGLMAAIRKIELDNFRERASMGRRGMAKQGRIPNTAMPYGYRRGERGKPEIEENEAEIVRRIFHQCAYEGMGGKFIANQLMADGVPPRKSGTYWHASSIIRLIRNQVYKDGIWWYGKNRHLLTENGRRVHRQPEDTWIPISFPPLVDETTWERAQISLRGTPFGINAAIPPVEHQLTRPRIVGIYEKNGNEVHGGAAGSGTDTSVSLTFQPTSDGYYFLAVGSNPGDRTGMYYFYVKESNSVLRAATNNSPTGGPGITGVPRAGEVLTATTSGTADADGLENAGFSYQWIRHNPATNTDTDILGATDSTYTVTREDRDRRHQGQGRLHRRRRQP